MRTMLLVAALALVVAACGSASETIAEQIAESNDGISDVDIDDDTVSFNVETDDGGEAQVVIGGGEIPDDFPAPVPPGGTVGFTSFQSAGDGSLALVAITYPADQFDSLAATYELWLSSEGYVVSKSETTAAGMRSAFLSGERESGSPTFAGISIAEDGTGNLLLNIQLGDG